MPRRRLALAFVPLAAAVAAGPRPLAAADWPAWRGVRGDGIVDAGPLPERWPETGLRPLWRRPIGTGFSAITTAAGKLFTAYGDKDHEYCAAIDAASGTELWRQPIGRPYFGSDPGGGPRSTPIFDDGRVYAVGSHGHLWSFDAATGRPLWNVDLAARFKARKPIYGFAASPLIHGELLLFNAGGPKGSSLIAFDKKTGAVRWKTADDVPGYSTPVVREIAGRPQAVFFTARGLVGVDPAAGTVLWRAAWETYDDANAMTPVVHADRVFIASGSGSLAVEIQRRPDGSYHAAEVWRDEELPIDYSNVILVDGHVYGISGGALICIELATGKRRWEHRGFSAGNVLGFANRKLVAAEYECSLTLVDASPESYRQQSRFTVFPRSRCITGPTVSDGRLFMRNEKEIVAFELRSEAAAVPASGEAPAGAPP